MPLAPGDLVPEVRQRDVGAVLLNQLRLFVSTRAARIYGKRPRTIRAETV